MDEKLNVTTVNRPARVEFVDLAKGITIMIMVMYHTGVGEPFYGAYSMIMIPVFYVTSGMFFKDYGGLKAFIVNRFHRLIVPFLTFYIGSYVLFYILKLLAPQLQTGTSTGILDVFKQRLWFDFPIWFMLALFVASIIFAAIHATLKKEAWRVVAVIAVGAAGVALGKFHIFVPCYLDCSLTAVPFYYCGFLLQKTPLTGEWKHDRFNIPAAIALYAAAVGLHILGQKPRIEFMGNGMIGFVALFAVTSVAAVVSLLLLCKAIKRLPVVNYLGRYSVVTLGMHLIIYRPVNLIMVRLGIESAILGAVATILLCLACVPLFIRFLPFLFGRKTVQQPRG